MLISYICLVKMREDI